MKIVFMGTPEFAVASLSELVRSGCTIAGVVTAPDKPAGRGLQMQTSAVKKYAQEKNIKVLQPEKLKDETFLSELKSLKADLQIVVAFRMLPEVVWKMPQKGTFNLHASLLPQYRGAAPINRAIINGEKETGVTTFFLNHEIDAGQLILQEKISIGEDETAGELHDKLMNVGAKLVLKTVRAIENNEVAAKEQSFSSKEVLKSAPKIFKEDCRIDWNKSLLDIHNFIRGLSPYPTAWTELKNMQGEKTQLKIFKSNKEIIKHNHSNGAILTDKKTFAKVAVTDGFIYLEEIQLSGKKRMNISEFLRGFPLDAYKI